MKINEYDMIITCKWEPERKGWLLVGSTRGHGQRRLAKWMRIDASGAPTERDVWSVLEAVKREVESWLW